MKIKHAVFPVLILSAVIYYLSFQEKDYRCVYVKHFMNIDQETVTKDVNAEHMSQDINTICKKVADDLNDVSTKSHKRGYWYEYKNFTVNHKSWLARIFE